MTRRKRRNNQPKLKNKQIVEKNFSFIAEADNAFVFQQDLIANPTNIEQPTGVYDQPHTGYVETIGGFELNCTLEGSSNLNNVSMYIMYLPEGYNVSTDFGAFVFQHPEWILAYKYLGSPTEGTMGGQGCQPIRIRSRYRRNLLTGDKLILVVSGYNSNSTRTNGTIWATIRFASKIN